jgi:hypothetical protein
VKRLLSTPRSFRKNSRPLTTKPISKTEHLTNSNGIRPSRILKQPPKRRQRSLLRRLKSKINQSHRIKPLMKRNSTTLWRAWLRQLRRKFLVTGLVLIVLFKKEAKLTCTKRLPRLLLDMLRAMKLNKQWHSLKLLLLTN